MAGQPWPPSTPVPLLLRPKPWGATSWTSRPFVSSTDSWEPQLFFRRPTFDFGAGSDGIHLEGRRHEKWRDQITRKKLNNKKEQQHNIHSMTCKEFV